MTPGEIIDRCRSECAVKCDFTLAGGVLKAATDRWSVEVDFPHSDPGMDAVGQLIVMAENMQKHGHAWGAGGRDLARRVVSHDR